jgi:hypothetical protein
MLFAGAGDCELERDRPNWGMVDNDTAERWRDIIALRLDDEGLPVRLIGRILKMPPTTVHRRLAAMPEEAKRVYRRAALERLDSA